MWIAMGISAWLRTNILAAMELIHWRWLRIRLVGCLLFREMGLRALFNQLKLLCPLGDLGTAANNHVKWWEQWEMSTTIGGIWKTRVKQMFLFPARPLK